MLVLKPPDVSLQPKPCPNSITALIASRAPRTLTSGAPQAGHHALAQKVHAERDANAPPHRQTHTGRDGAQTRCQLRGPRMPHQGVWRFAGLIIPIPKQTRPWERHPCRDDVPPVLPESSRPEAAPTGASVSRGSGIPAATMHRRCCQSHRGQRPLPQPPERPVGAASLPRRCTAGAA